MTNIDKHTKRIQALAAKAQSGTEAEMAEAIKAMHAYAAKYSLDLDALKSAKSAEAYVDSEELYSEGPGRFHLVDTYCVRKIQTFTNTIHRVIFKNDGNYIIFFGEPVNVEFAKWLRLSIARRLAFLWERHRINLIQRNGGTKKLDLGNEKIAFYKAACNTIGSRMAFIQKEYEKTNEGSTDLVVAKEAALNEALRARGIFLRGHAHGRGAHSAASEAAGKVAGNMVDLGRGVSGGARVAISHHK